MLYNYIKENGLSTNYSDHVVQGSDLLNKLYSLNNVDLIIKHYWLRQSVISNACDIIKAEIELKKLDIEKKKSYQNDIYKLQKKLNKSSKSITRQKLIRKINKLHQKVQLLENKKYTCIFGGRKLFFERCRQNISHEDFIEHRLSPVYSKGSKEHFNRLFEIKDDLKTVVFKPTADKHIELHINDNEYSDQIKSLYFAQKKKELPCTFKIGLNHIYISYDNALLNKDKYKALNHIKDRVMSIDLNPNYIGWTITDWKSENSFNIIKSGIYSLKELNDLHFSLKNKHYDSDSKERTHINNKRLHSIYEISKRLINIAVHYQCELFGYEQLKINSDDKNKGKKFNSLCNNLWCRNDLVNNLKKRCDLYHIEHREQLPEYSSFIGNFLFRKLNLPDMGLSAFEIGRRTYQSIYNFSIPKEDRKKNIVFPDLEMYKVFLAVSLEEFRIEDTFEELKNQYDSFKKSKKMYRLSLDKFNLKFSKLFPADKFIEHTFIDTCLTS